MGAINLKHTGSGSDVTLSSDGTDLLLDGTAIGGGGGASLDLYAESTYTFTAPTANTGGAYNSVAIGNGADIGYGRGESIAIGTNSFCNQSQAIALGHGATTSGFAGVTLGRNATATGQYATAIGVSYASGTDSFAAAIDSNSSSYGATNTGSIALGNQNKAAGYESFVAGGYANTANNYRSTVINGTSNTVNSNYGTILGGEGNTVNSSSNYSIILGGEYNSAGQQYTIASGIRAKTSVRGQWAHSAGHFSATGDAQSSKYVLRSDTTDATAEVLTSTNSSGGINNQVIVPTGAAVAFHGTIVAKQSGSANAAAWQVEGLIVNNGGTTTLTNSTTTVISNTPSWGMALSGDNTNDVLAITVTGAAATNIRWVATIHTSEVTYA